MAVPGDPYDACLRELHAHAAESLPPGTRWFDCHTHTGWHDPDGYTATAEEIVAGLDRAGHARALVFCLQEPDGYPMANDRVLAEAAASGGRLRPVCRVDPHAGALAEARRSVAAGAVGIKLHPRAERFELHDPAVEEVVAFAGQHRLPVIIHAGRGIPALGRDAVELARRHPDTGLILAHAGISDLAWIWQSAREVPNLLFDTAWWNVADLIAMFALIPPGQILYASDMPYGSAILSSLILLRIGRAVGLGVDALTSIAGGQLERLLAGEEPADLGPAPGPPATRAALAADRAAHHLTAAISRAFARRPGRAAGTRTPGLRRAGRGRRSSAAPVGGEAGGRLGGRARTAGAARRDRHPRARRRHRGGNSGRGRPVNPCGLFDPQTRGGAAPPNFCRITPAWP